MSVEQRYHMWEKQVIGPLKKEEVAHGPFVLLSYPYGLPIEEIKSRKQQFLLRQNIPSANRVTAFHYGTDPRSDIDFKVESEMWQARGVNPDRHMVNEIYATRIETKITLSLKSI